MFLIGGVVVVWLCWLMVVGFRFDCVDLGLLRLVSWSGFDLSWFVYWVYGFDLLENSVLIVLEFGEEHEEFDGLDL